MSGLVELPGRDDVDLDCFDSDHLDLVEIDHVKFYKVGMLRCSKEPIKLN